MVADHPDTGHFRIRSLLKEDEFIEIFEFYFSGNLLKYSYSYIKDDKLILRYDNAPHHPEIQTHPHHKHLKNEIQPLKKPILTEFINDAKKCY